MTGAKQQADFQVGFFELDDDEYHADPCLVPSLNASTAWLLVNECPAAAYYQHPRFGNQKRKDARHFDRGTCTHKLVLGKGKAFKSLDFDDYKTAASREARDEARAVGRVPVLEKEFYDCQLAAEAIKRRMKELGITFVKAKTELGAFWTEEASNGQLVQCRALLDYYRAPRIVDLKTARSAHPRACEAHSAEYGYALREAAYRSAVTHIKPELVGRVDMLFLFAELESPYFTTPAKLSPMFSEIGEKQWRTAIDTWAECIEHDAWPDYANGGIIGLDAPRWLAAQHSEGRW